MELAREAWGGGTNIGASLREFLQRHGERHVGRDTLVVILSDGLDVGEPDMLRAAMRELHRRSAGVVWLNPLLETPGYEPTSRGMVAAWPFITTFSSVSQPDRSDAPLAADPAALNGGNFSIRRAEGSARGYPVDDERRSMTYTATLTTITRLHRAPTAGRATGRTDRARA